MRLTVIIRDEEPLRYLNEPCRFRTVHVDLTYEQLKQLTLRTSNEAISHVFIEEESEKR